MTVYRPLICPYAQIISVIGTNAFVYDIGCGGGTLLALLAKYRQPKKLTGHDVRQDVVDGARSLVEQVASPMTEVNIFRLEGDSDLQLAGYDYVTLIDVFHHIPRQSQDSFLRRIYQSMPKGAYLILKDIDGGSILRFMNKLHDLLVARQMVHEVPVKVARQKLESLGFQVISETRKNMMWYPHFLIVARK